MNSKVFDTLVGETLLGVLRPSLWTAVPRAMVCGVFMLFPIVFLFPLLSLGPVGLAIGAFLFLLGAHRLRKIRDRWLYSALYITDRRIVDMFMRGKKPFEAELVWSDIDEISMRRGIIGWLLRIGTIRLEGTEDAGMTIELRAVSNPKVVQNFLLEVQCHTTDKAFARAL